MLDFATAQRNTGSDTQTRNIKPLFPSTSVLPPKTLSHAPRTRINLSRLINTLNFKNFRGDTISASFIEKKHGQHISIPVHPGPCSDNHLECTWEDSLCDNSFITQCEFLSLSITDGLNQFLVDANIQGIDSKGISLVLPDQCYNITQRNIKRNQCKGFEVQVIKNGTCLSGTLADFSSSAFRVTFPTDKQPLPPCNNCNNTLHVIIKNDTHVYFFDECEIIRKTTHSETTSVVMKSHGKYCQKNTPTNIRSPRHTFSPCPDITFNHPFTGEKTQRSIIDLSGSGLCVEENLENAVLLPGMIIPELNIEFMNSFSIKCKVQVLYSNKTSNSTIKCGLAFIDMNSQEHTVLSNLLRRMEDKNSYIGTTSVNTNALWDFFFETGFIYPKKYAFITKDRAAYKRLYEKLYSENSKISRHVVYQENGKVYGHAATLRTYEKTWMIHHHAAITKKKKAGLVVMDHLSRLIADYHPLESSMMDYIICYFRPENRFPNRIFGDIAQNTNNQKQCSIDSFAYFHTNTSPSTINTSHPYSLEIATPADLLELNEYYNNKSGGLLIQALDLGPEKKNAELDITSEYRKAGFKRERHIYSLKNSDQLLAIFTVNISDAGLNMSDLSNCIHVVVLDSANTTKEEIQAALNTISRHYGEQEHIPVLMYPSSFAEEQELPVEKKYNLWILDLKYGNLYLEHINKLLPGNRGKTKPAPKIPNDPVATYS